jgi:UDPglucose 6-dehydrogenase/GDP-mannose 6-dehydrogenase
VKLSIIGTGYVGLISGVCFAEMGVTVTCVDTVQAKVDLINAGTSPLYEPGLEAMLQKNLAAGRLHATTDILTAVQESDISLIAVGTPFVGDATDLSYIRGVATDIGRALATKDGYHVVAVKSTVPPGTTDEVVLPLLTEFSGKTPGEDFGVGMNPEFLREGAAVYDFLNPDRIVIGGMDGRTIGVLNDLYHVFPDVDVLTTNNRTAEMIKYTSNSLLATLISFSNEIANICSRTPGVDVTEVMAGVHLDKRFNPILPDGSRVNPQALSYLKAGCGFGGSCFPKDVKSLIAYARSLGVTPRLLESVIAINQDQPMKIIELLSRHLPSLRGRTVTVLGLAFKPETDDMRESPSIPVIRHLVGEGCTVKAYDPIVKDGAKGLFGDGAVTYPSSLADALAGADAIILITPSQELDTLPSLVSAICPSAVVIDGRRVLYPKDYPRYEGIGMASSGEGRL